MMTDNQEQLRRLEEQWSVVMAEDERKHALISVSPPKNLLMSRAIVGDA
jgi:hypothetical protein